MGFANTITVKPEEAERRNIHMGFEPKLDLNQAQIDRCREAAQNITNEVQKMIDIHTTTSTERAILRLLGVDGVDDNDVPLPNVVIDQIHKAGKLSRGAAFWVVNAMIQEGISIQEVADRVGRSELDITKLPLAEAGKIRALKDKLAAEGAAKVRNQKQTREDMMKEHPIKGQPWIYVIVATGNIYEDVLQAQAAARQGADIIAVIRSTAQSLLDYLPYGATTEGFGGTYATQENFRIMRAGLDEVIKETGHYVMLVNYASGLCMPEVTAAGSIERLDMMLNDSMYGILFRDINPTRTFVDQYFSRVINSYSGIIINTGEDNYLTTDDAYEAAHTVLASQFMNEAFAFKAGLPAEQMGLGHAFEMAPDIENGFLYELAQAFMARQIFPNAPLKYMPPTKHMTGNIWQGVIQDALFNAVSIISHQGIQLLGMLTEAIHTPFLQDRFLAIQNAQYVFNNMKNLGDDISIKPDGIMSSRAKEVLGKATDLLELVEGEGLLTSIAEGRFAAVKRPAAGGKGHDGQLAKAPDYYNPFMPIMLKK